MNEYDPWSNCNCNTCIGFEYRIDCCPLNIPYAFWYIIIVFLVVALVYLVYKRIKASNRKGGLP